MKLLKAEGRKLKAKALLAFSLELSALLFAACSHPKPEPPAPAPPPPIMEPASPPPSGMVAPRIAAGSYRLHAEIQSGNTPPPRARNVPAPAIVLTTQPVATPAMGAPEGTQQFTATVVMTGYARAPRGRTGQAAAWWPVAGDSVVVQFSQGSRGRIQLRGALLSGTIRGEIWYLSLESGSTFQLGVFTATRQR